MINSHLGRGWSLSGGRGVVRAAMWLWPVEFAEIVTACEFADIELDVHQVGGRRFT